MSEQLPTEPTTANYGATFNTPAALTQPVKDGHTTYTFDKWTVTGTDSEGKVTGNVTVTGTWTTTQDAEYHATYSWTDAPGGNKLPVDETSYYAGDLFTAETTYTDNTTDEDDNYNYTFSGWTVFSGVDKDGKVTSDVTVTGTWTKTAKAYTVRYVIYKGATGQPEDATLAVNASSFKTAPAASLANKVFANWKDKNGKTYNAGTEIKETALENLKRAAADGVVTLTAQWSDVRIDFYINKNGTTDSSFVGKGSYTNSLQGMTVNNASEHDAHNFADYESLKKANFQKMDFSAGVGGYITSALNIQVPTDAAILKTLKDQKTGNVTVSGSTAVLDPDKINSDGNSDYYRVFWYVLKAAGSNDWHVDGYIAAKTYSVTYKVEGEVPTDVTGTIPTARPVVPGNTVEVPQALTSTSTGSGSKKGTWSFAWDMSALTSDNGSYKMPAKDVTVVGHWTFTESGTYTVNYYSDNKLVKTENPYTGDSYKVLSQTEAAVVGKTGYTFAGWTTQDKVSTTIGAEVAGSGTINYYANWNPINYTITWMNGETELGKTTAAYGTTPSCSSTPVRDATVSTVYTFKDWNTQADGKGSGVTAVTGDATYYAQFTESARQYTLTYESGENAPADVTLPNPSTKDYNSKWTVEAPSSKTAGYTFTGWTVKEPASLKAAVMKLLSAAEYQQGDEITVEHDLTLVANWTLAEYTVSYNANGGSNAPTDSKTYTAADTVTLSTTAPTRSDASYGNYTFNGWSLTPDGTAVTSVNYADAVSGVATVYAIWTHGSDKINYTVTFQNDDGTAIGAPETLHYGDKVTVPADPTRTGYTFTGWTSDGGKNVLKAAAIPAVTGSVTYVAVYKVNSYKISYKITGSYFTDETYADTAADYGTAYTLETAKAHGGYTFSGWTLTDSEGKTYTAKTMPAGNLTATGSYTYTYNGGGYVGPVVSPTPAQPTTIPDDKTPEGDKPSNTPVVSPSNTPAVSPSNTPAVSPDGSPAVSPSGSPDATIPDDDVPQGDKPSDIPDANIPDDETPHADAPVGIPDDATPTAAQPKTGDSSRLDLFAILAAASAAGLAALGLTGKKKKNGEEK